MCHEIKPQPAAELKDEENQNSVQWQCYAKGIKSLIPKAKVTAVLKFNYFLFPYTMYYNLKRERKEKTVIIIKWDSRNLCNTYHFLVTWLLVRCQM